MQDLSEREKRQVREATRVVARMLCVHPCDRPSCEELLQDKFFTDETSPEALKSTLPPKLKGVATDNKQGTVNGMPRACVQVKCDHSSKCNWAHSNTCDISL
jgi:hypothetical protein